MFHLTRETSDDRADIDALYDLCFSPGRTSLSSYRLRDDVEPIWDLCLFVRDEMGLVVGAIRYWPVMVGHEHALLLGPIAVHPTRQGDGLGAALVDKTLHHAKELGWQRVILVGDAPYYQRFGFSKLPDVIMPPPTNPDRVLGISLQPGAWEGVTGSVGKFRT